MFIFEGDHGILPFDFQIEILEQMKINAWLNNESADIIVKNSAAEAMKYIIENVPKDKRLSIIPIGSIEFVNQITAALYDNHIHAMNVPEALTPYSGRPIYKNCSSEKVIELINSFPTTKFFIKNSDELKDLIHICTKDDPASWRCFLSPSDQNKYDVSFYLDKITSEWRCFVYKGQILDVRQYAGNWEHKINDSFIKNCVLYYEEHGAPPAYTIDFGTYINSENEETDFIVEVHPFVSCGTYGFSNKNIIRMARDAYLWAAKQR